ncbi:MAG: HAD hydrolase-like protein [Lewinella sp.]|nr:HAD hydrolase-like protein [Lewinella sp.]
MGTEKSAYYLEGTGLEGIPISEFNYHKSPDVRALVLLDEEGFDWNRDLNKAINLIRRKNIPIIVANSDETYPVSKHEVHIAIGGIADMLEAIVGKKVIRFGKPSSQMFIFAFQYLQTRVPVSKEDILMVGDTLSTDIMGGNKFGIDTALVLTGNTSAEQAKFLIKSTGIIPDFVCKSAVI